MFPIGKSKLSLREIANYWAREIQPPASRNELLELLEGAWWRGQIHGDSVKSRLDLLKYMFEAMHDRDDVGIVFLVECFGLVEGNGPSNWMDWSLIRSRLSQAKVTRP